MRQVWRVTRPLDGDEWAEYWVNEHINDKGMLADLDVCAGAAQYREEEALHVAEQCSEITAGLVAKPTMSGAINDWLYPRLPDDLAELMVKERDAETGEVKRLTGAKDIITRLLEEIKISDTPPDDDVIDLLELLQYGRSSSAVKFQKVLDQAVDGRLHNSYVFNGAGQSGRYSSRGVQVHNLVRDYLRGELDILDKVAARVPIEDLRAIPISDREIDVRRAKEGKTSVSSVLSRLIRPTFMAPEKKLMVWSDWSAIEARVAPWLAGTDEADRAVLQPFRDGSDLYLLNAEAIFGVPYDQLVERLHNGDKEAKGMRQAGKVAVLALGFLGGVGALRAMARGYGMRLTNEEAKVIVDGWRDRNRWARKFGDACERAAYEAISNPMRLCKAGRVSYQYVPTLMGGSLLCYLPDGRPLMYPMARVVDVEKFGKPDKAISYLNGMGRRNMWNGLQVENCLAGDTRVLTRNGIKRLDMVQTTDLVWDGIEWVQHYGLVTKGEQPVIARWGVQLTPDHRVLTNAGWREAKDCKGSDRANVRLPDDVAAIRGLSGTRQESAVAGALRVRQGTGGSDRRVPKQPQTFTDVMRLHDQRALRSGQAHPRYVEAQGVRRLALDGRPLHLAFASRVEELRRAGHHSMRTVAGIVHRLLGGHGAKLFAGVDARQGAQQRGVLTGELPLGRPENAVAQHALQSDDRHTSGSYAGGGSLGDERYWGDDVALPTERGLADSGSVSAPRLRQSVQVVYDLRDCGPRHRFTVIDGDGRPFIVHNCTQGLAASILRSTLTRVHQRFGDVIIGDTHDEVICEVDATTAWAFADQLDAVMVEGFPWSKGLPLAAETTVNWYYSKGPGMKRPQ